MSATELKLRNGARITLAGLKVPERLVVETKRRLEEIVLHRPIILIPAETNPTSCIVYAWGRYDLKRELLPAEKRGFLNVDAGFMNVQKGIALNVNAVLIREGYARVDTNALGDLTGDFVELENRSREDHRGIWKQ